MNWQRRLGLVISAWLHGGVLIAVIGLPPLSSRSVSLLPARKEPLQVEIMILSDLHHHAFDFDIEKIGSRVGRLLPFTEPILLSSTTRAPGTGGNGRAFVLGADLAAKSPPLTLSVVEMQAVLDASWSRRQRWDSFQQILDLTQRFDPQQGDLPMLLRRYANDNLLQPFHASQNPEPRVWGSLSVAADHFNFVQFITAFVQRVPSSKVTTELLFLLDKLVQANLQAALTLFELDTVNGMSWTKSMSPKGAATLIAVHRHHERALGRRGMWDTSALARRYDDVRVGILRHLIRTTPQGYRVNDARFLIGEIHWHQRRQSEAFEAWGGIRPDQTDEYFVAYSEVRASIEDGVTARPQIDAVLNEQTRRWVDASFRRLRHFGFAFDTY